MRRLITSAFGIPMLFVLSGIAPAKALAPVYYFRGSVIDPIGRPIVDAQVNDGGQTVMTDSSGAYALPEYFTGTYNITEQKVGLVSDTQQESVLVPADMVVNFNPLYTLASSVVPPQISTASGPVVLRDTLHTFAPSPGQPGQPGSSCVQVVDDRTGQMQTTTYTGVQDPGFEWTADVTVPQNTVEAEYSITARVVDCASGVALTYSAPIPYLVDNTPPALSNFSPTALTTANTTISLVYVETRSGVDPGQSKLLVDGASVPVSINGETSTVSTTVNNLADGSHNVLAHVYDHAGNEADAAWTFEVDSTPPSLDNPAPVGISQSRSPLISVAAHDLESGVSAPSATMSISNGVLTSAVAATYDATSGLIAYQVPDHVTGTGLGQFPLPDGTYAVTAEVSDVAGNKATLSWTFQIKTLLP